MISVDFPAILSIKQEAVTVSSLKMGRRRRDMTLLEVLALLNLLAVVIFGVLSDSCNKR